MSAPVTIRTTTLSVRRSGVAAAVVLLLAVLSSAGIAQAPVRLPATARRDSSALPITTILASTRYRVSTALRAVLRTPAELERYWQDVRSADGTPAPSLPSIDFSREMVIVAALGFQPGAGAQITVTRVRDWNATLEVTLRITVPPKGCDGWPMVEYPMTMVRVPISRSTPVFHDRLIQPRC